MSLRRPRSAAIACVVAALAGGALTGCHKREVKPAIEGQGIKVAGVTYNVYITRQLNPRDAEDSAYVAGQQNADQPGYYFFGVFLTACNHKTDGTILTPTDNFAIRDTQGDRFPPLRMPLTNVFAYRPKRLAKNSCVPAAGTAAATGPTSGALLVFRVPVVATENRPLELQISAGGESKLVELDI